MECQQSQLADMSKSQESEQNPQLASLSKRSTSEILKQVSKWIEKAFGFKVQDFNVQDIKIQAINAKLLSTFTKPFDQETIYQTTKNSKRKKKKTGSLQHINYYVINHQIKKIQQMIFKVKEEVRKLKVSQELILTYCKVIIKNVYQLFQKNVGQLRSVFQKQQKQAITDNEKIQEDSDQLDFQNSLGQEQKDYELFNQVSGALNMIVDEKSWQKSIGPKKITKYFSRVDEIEESTQFTIL